MTPSPILSVRNLTVDFDHGHIYARALHGIDLDVSAGSTLGVVGESGCGKSITWLAVLGLLDRRTRIAGSATLNGGDILNTGDAHLSSVRGSTVAMIFQDPSSSLNPVHRIGKQLTEALTLHRGLRGAAAKAEAARLLDRVGISNAPQRLNEYPHELSGGMNQRVMIAMALAGEPDILIADEPTTALDATIQAQILDLLKDVQRERGMALVLISHDLGVVAEAADRVAVMYCGRIVEEGPTGTLFARPVHPYTAGLLDALPDLDGPKRRLRAIPGRVPPPQDLPPGCSFAPRCDFALEACGAAVPMLERAEAASHRAACIRIADLIARDATVAVA